MKSIRSLVLLCAIASLAGAGTATTAFAHHSQSQFEPETTISIEGTLTKASWANPHTLFVIEAKKAGSGDAAQEWTVEGPSPRQLEAKGWGKGVSKAGRGAMASPSCCCSASRSPTERRSPSSRSRP